MYSLSWDLGNLSLGNPLLRLRPLRRTDTPGEQLMPAGRFVKRSERKQKKLKLAKEVKAGGAGRHLGTFLFCRHLGTLLARLAVCGFWDMWPDFWTYLSVH